MVIAAALIVGSPVPAPVGGAASSVDVRAASSVSAAGRSLARSALTDVRTDGWLPRASRSGREAGEPGPTAAPSPTGEPTPSPTATPETTASPAEPAPPAKPSATPPPAPAPAPAPQPAPAPPPGSRPGVGVPAGTALTVWDGDLTITTPGTVIDALDIHGYVRVKATDVIIKRSVIRGRPGLNSYMSLVQAGDGASRLTIEDSELVATVPSPYVDGIVGKGFTLRRVNVHGVVDSVKITGDDVLVENSWLHGNLYFLNDPNYGGKPTHDDNVQIQQGNNITVRGTVMSDTHNAAMMITQDFGSVSNVTWSENRADGGACTINVAEKSYGPVHGLTISRTTFGFATRVPRCSILLPATTAPLANITGNVYTDGSPVTVSRG